MTNNDIIRKIEDWKRNNEDMAKAVFQKEFDYLTVYELRERYRAVDPIDFVDMILAALKAISTMTSPKAEQKENPV